MLPTHMRNLINIGPLGHKAAIEPIGRKVESVNLLFQHFNRIDITFIAKFLIRPHMKTEF